MANPANSTAYKLGDGRMAVDVTENKTLTVDDCGYVQNVIGGTALAPIVVSVPATATLGAWNVRNGGSRPTNGAAGAVAGGNGVAVSPVAADRIQGGVAGTATDNKDLLTNEISAEVSIANVAETNGPLVSGIKGTWTREA